MSVDWVTVVTTILTSIGGGGLVLAAATYLIKTALSQRLILDAEVFKANLKADADTEIERIRSEYQMRALEHQVRFSKLHEKRADVIAETFRLQEELHRLELVFMAQAMPGKTPSRDLEGRVQKSMADFVSYVRLNELYFPESVSKVLWDLTEALESSLMAVQVYEDDQGLTPAERWQERLRVMRPIVQRLTKDVPNLRSALISEFRTLLGGN